MTAPFDLEDAIAAGMKEQARLNLAQVLSARRGDQHHVIRVNEITGPEFHRDMVLVAELSPDAVLVPKVGSAMDIQFVQQSALRDHVKQSVSLWIMIETVAALSQLDGPLDAALGSSYRLACLVVGTNDIASETGVHARDDRRYLLPWLMDVVLAAKRRGLVVLDGVWNDFKNEAGFQLEATQARKMAFDGKTLIHPSQIGPANEAFAPSREAVREAHRIKDAFSRPKTPRQGYSTSTER